MRSVKRITFVLCLLLFAVMLFACGEGESGHNSALVTLSKKNVSFENLDEYERIEATVASYDGLEYAVTWTTSNENVATCVDGLITAIGWGTCVVRAEVSDTVFASCIVTVNDPNPTINLSTTEIIFGDIG